MFDFRTARPVYAAGEGLRLHPPICLPPESSPKNNSWILLDPMWLALYTEQSDQKADVHKCELFFHTGVR